MELLLKDVFVMPIFCTEGRRCLPLSGEGGEKCSSSSKGERNVFIGWGKISLSSKEDEECPSYGTEP